LLESLAKKELKEDVGPRGSQKICYPRCSLVDEGNVEESLHYRAE